MSASGMGELADQVKQTVGGFQPQSREQIEDFFRGLPEVIASFTQGLNQAADNMGDEHIHEAVAETTRELAGAIQGASDAADEVFKEHLVQHKIWLD